MNNNLGVLSSNIKSFDFIFKNNLNDLLNLYSIACRNIQDSKKLSLKYKFKKYYGSYEEFIEDNNIDFVINFLPPEIKFEYTYLLLKANKKVIIDYPLINSINDISFVDEIFNSSLSKNLFLVDNYNFKKLKSLNIKNFLYIKTPFKNYSKLSPTTKNLLNEESPDLIYLINEFKKSKIKISILDKNIHNSYNKLLYLNAFINIDNDIKINVIIDNLNSLNSKFIINNNGKKEYNSETQTPTNLFNYQDLIEFIKNNKSFEKDAFFQYYPFKLFNEVINE